MEQILMSYFISTSQIPRNFAICLCIISIIYLQYANAVNEVYEYQDSKGHTVFSNINKESIGKTITLPPLNIYAQPMSKSDVFAEHYTAKPVLTPTKAYLRINNSNLNNIYFSNKQNNTRQQILSEELVKEKAALNNSQKTLIVSQKIKYSNENNTEYNERIKALKDSITAHQKNIEILQKELNN
jgi:hypothetical protein